ncbi:MAG: DNA polymerase III subunit beta [Lachnospiraceae bacterium]|nr:DNA polymerase III subunit beta [Lachnospiraceae bacterium]
MKLVCKKSIILNGLQIVSKAVPVRTTFPILECILIDASKGEIKLIANDTDLGIETVIEGDIVEPGILALEAKIFVEMIRKLPENDITIVSDGNYNTVITCEKTKFNLLGKSGDDFSYLPKIEKKNNIVISQFTLKEVIRQTIFSIADNDNKIMMGELFEVTDDHLKIVSLDGHRISLRNIALKNSYDHIKVIVPGKALNEISKILTGEADKDVTIFFTDRHIMFEFDSTIVLSRLIEGEYFQIDNMLSKDYESKIHISKKELYDCIDRASLMVKEGDKKPIILDVKDRNLELMINSVVGSMNENIDIQKTGTDMKIGFNPKFLMDALKVIDDDEIDMYLINPKSPCIIRDNDGSYVYLILPVNFTVSN